MSIQMYKVRGQSSRSQSLKQTLSKLETFADDNFSLNTQMAVKCLDRHRRGAFFFKVICPISKSGRPKYN